MRARPRSILKLEPTLDRLEERSLQSVLAGSNVQIQGRAAILLESHGQGIVANAKKPTSGYLVYRITNPNRFNNHLTPPFAHVLVQSAQPVPGQVYNLLYVAVRNGTAKTFDASSGLGVRFPGQADITPILQGDQQWKPGREIVFYVLTKRYYPIANQASDGFEFDLGGARSIAIPGPSGIFLRLTYNPDTIDKVIDAIVSHGKGAQGGTGIKFGMPDTAIYEFVSAKTQRNDFGGYF